jgi:hypothetical protein
VSFKDAFFYLQQLLTLNRLIAMLKRIFTFKKRQKTLDELKQEQYILSLQTITEHYNGVRINETLVGRIKGMRMTEVDCVVSESDAPKVPTLRSVPRPKTFGSNLMAWMDEVRQEAKAVINKNKQYEKEEKEFQEQLKTEKNNKALKERREFFVNYGLLPKVPA